MTSAEGGIYELVARGNKDVYFFQDLPDSKFLFDNSYEPQEAFSYEIRRVPPKTAAEFGRTVEFDIDVVGDIIRNPTLLITLPSWLPTQQSKTNTVTLITDSSGVSYGYTQNIAYFLFQNIQLFQDNILLQEFSGDALWATALNEGTYGSTFVTQALTGGHDGTPRSIAKNATPGLLRLELPLIGCQKGDKGFPIRATTKHSYKLRIKLRKLEDLVEASDKRAKPAPWNQINWIQQTSSSQITFNTFPKEQIGPLSLTLETTQVYVSGQTQVQLESKPVQIPFKRLFLNTFSQNTGDYTNVLNGGQSVVKRRIDGRHPTSRFLFFFRSIEDENANRLYSIATSSGNPYYNSISLQIAGQTRELPRSSLVWRDITNVAKEELDTGTELNTMNWTFGSIPMKRFDTYQPNGTINMTTADRATFYIDLANPETFIPATQLYVITEGWGVFQTDGKGRAELFSQN